ASAGDAWGGGDGGNTGGWDAWGADLAAPVVVWRGGGDGGNTGGRDA
ncbi:unnamed protein product, partial [Fusarium fujikuroi]